MEAIVPAFLLAVLSQLGERPAMLTAILSDRYRLPLTVALGAGLAHAALSVIAAIAGLSMAPILTPNAQALLLGLALVVGGVSAFWPVKPPRRYEKLALGAFPTPLVAVGIVAAGGQTPFFTLALATRGEPWFAAGGAAVGAFAVGLVAAILGEQGWNAIRFGAYRIGCGIVFLAAGAWIGLGALRLT